jgi:hypothetical protein
MRLSKVTTSWPFIIAVALGSLFGGVWLLLHHLYYKDRIRVISELGQVRGITDVVVTGFDDVGYDVVSARFHIEGRPEAVIEIREPQEGLVGSPNHLWLKRLGPWEFHQCTYGYQGAYTIETGKPAESLAVSDFVDVVSSGEFAAMLPVEVRDVNDLVAHYDELVRYFATWPDETTWGRLDEPAGIRRAYCRTTLAKRPLPPPKNFPATW